LDFLKKSIYKKITLIRYAVSVEELAAKVGTGKKYGRPKRLA
jgi:hypothetical protein